MPSCAPQRTETFGLKPSGSGLRMSRTRGVATLADVELSSSHSWTTRWSAEGEPPKFPP